MDQVQDFLAWLPADVGSRALELWHSLEMRDESSEAADKSLRNPFISGKHTVYLRCLLCKYLQITCHINTPHSLSLSFSVIFFVILETYCWL